MGLPGLVRRADRVAKEYIEKSDCHTGTYADNKRRLNGSVHAEIDALKQLVRQKRGAEGATITVIRYLADDSFGASKPCADCMEAIKEAGIKRINYFDYDGSLYIQRI